MIDLGQIKNVTYPIKLADGKIIHLKKPSQTLLTSLIGLQNYTKSMQDNAEEGLELMGKVYDMMTAIFNTNIEKITFETKEIESMIDISNCLEVLEDYFNFVETELGK